MTEALIPNPLRVPIPLPIPSKIACTLLKNKKAELSDLSDKLLSAFHLAPIRANEPLRAIQSARQ